MTANQYRAALDRLGLTQVGAARLFRIGERTSRRWADEGVTGTAEILIGLMLAGKVTAKDIERTSIPSPKSRVRDAARKAQ
jgi:hypothetical protein